MYQTSQAPPKHHKPAQPLFHKSHTLEGAQVIEEKHAEIQSILDKLKHLAS